LSKFVSAWKKQVYLVTSNITPFPAEGWFIKQSVDYLQATAVFKTTTKNNFYYLLQTNNFYFYCTA